MQTQSRTRSRLGMLGLLFAGVLFAVTLLLRGPVILDPAADPAGFAQAVTSDSYVAWALGTIAANVPSVTTANTTITNAREGLMVINLLTDDVRRLVSRMLKRMGLGP